MQTFAEGSAAAKRLKNTVLDGRPVIWWFQTRWDHLIHCW